MPPVVANCYFDYVIKLEKCTLEIIKIIILTTYICAVSDDFLNRHSNDSLGDHVNGETSDWLNHNDRPVNESGLPIYEL